MYRNRMLSAGQSLRRQDSRRVQREMPTRQPARLPYDRASAQRHQGRDRIDQSIGDADARLHRRKTERMPAGRRAACRAERMVLDGQRAGLRRGQRRTVAKKMGRTGAARRSESLVPERPIQIRVKHLPGSTDDVSQRTIVPLPLYVS